MENEKLLRFIIKMAIMKELETDILKKVGIDIGEEIDFGVANLSEHQETLLWDYIEELLGVEFDDIIEVLSKHSDLILKEQPDLYMISDKCCSDDVIDAIISDLKSI